jgi:uncharacterized membrane protein YccF (DUF307 family)
MREQVHEMSLESALGWVAVALVASIGAYALTAGSYAAHTVALSVWPFAT